MEHFAYQTLTNCISYYSIVTNFSIEGNDETKVSKRSYYFVRKKVYIPLLWSIYLCIIIDMHVIFDEAVLL